MSGNAISSSVENTGRVRTAKQSSSIQGQRYSRGYGASRTKQPEWIPLELTKKSARLRSFPAAFAAYRRAIEKVIPGALVEPQSEHLAVDDETIEVIVVRLNKQLDGRKRVEFEQRIHDRVEAENPAFVGLFAFRYADS